MRIRSCIALLLACLLLVLSALPCAAASQPDPELYPEEFFWDKAGEDADNGYKAYSVPFGAALKIPEDPQRYGCTFLGWKDWNTDAFVKLENETMNAKGRKFYAAWEQTIYTFRYFVFGNLLTTTYGAAGDPFVHPRYPQEDGYTFAGWDPKLPDVTPAQDMDFNAVFTPNTYIATLMVDGKVYKEIPYTYGQKSIDLPDVPKKDGCTGAWESYTLGVGGVTIHAIYTPIQYIATLLVDGRVYMEIPYFYGQKSISLPDVPEKEGYTGEWESYSLVVDGVTIHAIYTPKTYIATLLVDGKVYKEIPYTYGQKSIRLPAVPKKEGCYGIWEPYSLGIGGVTINAIYKPLLTTRTKGGDVDGDGKVNLVDAAVLQRGITDGWTSEVNVGNADVDGNNEIDLKDVVILRRYLAGGWDVDLA